MGQSTTLVIVIVALAVGVAALWMYRRGSATPKRSKSEKSAPKKNQAEQWGVRIATPARERACPQVRDLLGREFELAKKPPLPVPDCPFAHECQCHYVKLFDRRRHERRSHQDRRQAQRFDKDSVPRRSGKDRRRGQVEWAEPERD